MADQLAQDPDSRAEFEAWAKSRYTTEQGFWLRQIDDGGYSCGMADSAWAAWQRQQERIAELEAQVQALSLDAGRYRYLRSHCLCAGHGSITVFLDDRHGTGNRARPLHLEEMDTAIDAAIAAGKGEG